MKRILRKLFSKVTLVILICLIALLGFFFWGWIEKQAMKVKGMYLIYRGDQAYSQDNMAKTLEYYRKREEETGDCEVGDKYEGMVHINDATIYFPDMGEIVPIKETN